MRYQAEDLSLAVDSYFYVQRFSSYGPCGNLTYQKPKIFFRLVCDNGILCLVGATEMYCPLCGYTVLPFATLDKDAQTR